MGQNKGSVCSQGEPLSKSQSEGLGKVMPLQALLTLGHKPHTEKDIIVRPWSPWKGPPLLSTGQVTEASLQVSRQLTRKKGRAWGLFLLSADPRMSCWLHTHAETQPSRKPRTAPLGPSPSRPVFLSSRQGCMAGRVTPAPAQNSADPVFSPSSITDVLCDLEGVTSPLWASDTSSVRTGT